MHVSHKLLTVLLVSSFLCSCAMPGQNFAPNMVPVYAKIHIVASVQEFPADALRLYRRPLACAYQTGDVYVVGKKTNAGLTIDPYLLGHEILHLLSWYSGGRVRNPDTY